jgi:hypothetical protein
MPNQAAESSGDKRDAMVDDVEQHGGEEGGRSESAAARITATTPTEAIAATATATATRAAEIVAAPTTTAKP